MKKNCLLLILLFIVIDGFSQTAIKTIGREHLLMDADWRFSFGHPNDARKDFNNGTSYFSYFAKAGYGDGAAAQHFDDRSWRKLDLPHDWAVELPFSSKASFSHGFKALGRNFPETSVGWYRKKFTIPASDAGRRITIAFDGVFRNASVWVNGHFVGNEPSGYANVEYGVSEYLNYGGENTVAVRVDATMEEGWFYEGAGIYRHVWLNKTAPVHVMSDGTIISSRVNSNKADITARIRLLNEAKTNKTIDLLQTIIDASGKEIATATITNTTLSAYQEKELASQLQLNAPRLWSLEDPYLYTLVTSVIDSGKTIDQYTTIFGVRTIRFDANKGFFLNDKPIKIKGTNNHQDHAGVGAAMPDALQEFRIRTLKEMGCNAYRASHNPPTPELLDACDRLGMLVIDENRLMGVSTLHFDYMKRLMRRDINHPSIISWSIGNEEWAIEGNNFGAAIAATLQAYTKSIDSTRPVTAAVSGGWRKGISNVIEVMGYNYIGQINTDEHHAEFPAQPGWGTEEGSTRATRGIYFTDNAKQWIAAYDKKPTPNFYSIEEGWKHFAARDYLAGMFIWTGFDYRGEPTPFGFPSIGSYFGMMDQCGFPKDNVYYLRSWWMNKPTLHVFPHWNWPGKEGKEIDVWVYSNCDEVELFLNKKSVGKKVMQKNGHLEWKVIYKPGTVEAVGYKNGKKILTDKVQTTGSPVSIAATANQVTLKADKDDVAMVTIDVKDKEKRHVPTADNEIVFSVEGPAKIIGVGNGDPTSLEKDKFLPQITIAKIEGLKEKYVSDINNRSEVAYAYDDKGWQTAFKEDRMPAFGDSVKAIVYRGSFTLPSLNGNETITFFYNSLGKEQSVYINGKEVGLNLKETRGGNTFVLKAADLRAGSNTIAIAATPLLKRQIWDVVNMDAGLIQIITPAEPWKRKLFNGLAQVILQSTGEEGEVRLTATSGTLQPATLKIKTVKADTRSLVN